MHSEQHYLTPLFEPKSVAIIGASETPDSIGATLVRNMLDGDYKGKVFCVNPRHESVFGHPCYASIEQVPQKVDVAAICTRSIHVPDIVEACGKAGVKAVVVISGGFSEIGQEGLLLEKKTLEIARRYKVRLMGPNCLGIMRPYNGLNLTFAKGGAIPGSIGLVSQSGALCTAILDWALPNHVGFSAVMSLGTESDVDFGEALDFLVSDHRTEHIFLYIEGIRKSRRFMSALRAAARVKPVFLIKVGKNPAGGKAAFSHTGAIGGFDDVFDAAIRRSGVVRLHTVAQMFAAASALFLHFHPHGNRLAIITNGGGPGAMAADRADEIGIPLAELSDDTYDKLDGALPPNWSQDNPVDIVGDAGPTRFKAATEICLADPKVDGALIILTPQAMSDPTQVARSIGEVSRNSKKPIITCWMGEEQVRESRLLFQGAGIPNFRTPEPAVEMFSHISSYYRNQQLLMQVPGATAADHAEPHLPSARLVIETALMEGRHHLNEMESKALLAAFHIPIAQAVIARSATEAMLLAEEVGLPVVMKVVSPDITNKADVGGVRLNLHTLSAVRLAYEQIIEEVHDHSPEAQIQGISIEPMVHKPKGRELRVGVIQDPIFGPAITLAVGGVVIQQSERVVALPPLNSFLVADLLNSEKLRRRLNEFRNLPPVNEKALESVLLRISEMVCELPWLQTLVINPLIVDEQGAVAVDARIHIDALPRKASRYDHMAIHPYPAYLQEDFAARDGRKVHIRPIQPEDAHLSQYFVQHLSQESRYFRFMNTIRELSPMQLVRLTQIDYDREMALIALSEVDGEMQEVGVVRYASNPDGESCEFAIVVSDGWQGTGLAKKLMQRIIETARQQGFLYMTGDFLTENSRMLKFVADLGFKLQPHPDDPGLRHGILTLNEPETEAA
ncbi:MAG TPA: GNAT family N-acetyltransferase [Rhodocyclaceae bacterium]|nr:GNAT family N-acetyltransferase [Rhodocyclaceae bacterium]